MRDVVAIRIREALQVYAQAMRIEEEEPDHGYSILPVAEDLDEGKLEIHIVDTLRRGDDLEAVFLLSLTRIE